MSNPNKLGERIKKWRETQNLTRAQLAQDAGLSEQIIDQMEDQGVCPSIAPLQKVARALGVRLGTFMDDQITKDPIVSRKEDQDIDLTLRSSDSKRSSFRYHSLAKGKSDRAMEPFFVEIAPEKDEERRFSSHQGEEFILVMKGRVQVTYGTETHILEAGDTIYYNSAVPHHVGTANAESATICAVLYYPQ